MPTVIVGGDPVVVEPITGYKAIRGGRLLARAAAVAPAAFDALSEFRRKYRASNSRIITPELARLPRFQNEVVNEDGSVSYEPVFTDADFERAGGQIELPADPSFAEEITAVLPVVWDGAERPVIELIALLLSPNQQIKLADKTGTVDDYLATKAGEILHKVTLDEIVALVAVLGEMIGDAMGGGAAGEAVAKVAEMTGTGSPSQTNVETSSQQSQVTPDGVETTSSTTVPTVNSTA